MPPEKGKVTIYDVADHAGVAISTVSRVLNQSRDVSEQTRAKVLDAINTLQFRPDRTARTLAQQTTQALAVALPTFTTPFHNELLKGVRDALQDVDIDLLLCDLGSVHPRQTLLNFLKRGAVDGLLLAGVPIDGQLALELEALRAPVILIGSHSDQYDCFYWDDEAGARLAVEHLLRTGHSRIGMIRAHTDSSFQQARVQGYRIALESAGYAFDPSLVVHGATTKHAGFNEEAGYEAMEQLLSRDPRPTAVFVSSDVQAIGAWKAVIDAGLKVPDNLALVGYDDIKMSTFIDLTSVDQSMQVIGREATQQLLAYIGSDEHVERVAKLVRPQLRLRRSSRQVT